MIIEFIYTMCVEIFRDNKKFIKYKITYICIDKITMQFIVTIKPIMRILIYGINNNNIIIFYHISAFA